MWLRIGRLLLTECRLDAGFRRAADGRMSIRAASDVDGPARPGRPRVTSNLPLSTERILPVMTPIAAYRVMVASDLEREARRTSFRAPAARVSLGTRVSRGLETFARFGRPVTAHPASDRSRSRAVTARRGSPVADRVRSRRS